MPSMEDLTLLSDMLLSAGPLGASAFFLMLSVRLLRAENLQSLLPKRVRWSNLSPTAKVLLPMGGSLLAALLAVLGGASAPQVVPLALFVGFSSIGGHHLTKKLGEMLDDKSIKDDPFYEPGKVRQAAHLLLPMKKPDTKLYDKAP